MVVELVDDGTPDREGRGTGDADDAHDIAGYGVEEPVHEALVLHRPLQIDKLRGGGGDLNAGKKAELPDDGVEEATLLLVGGLDDVKNQRHMGLDLHHHEGGNCWRLRTGWAVKDAEEEVGEPWAEGSNANNGLSSMVSSGRGR